jgi:ketosteroid isomerase-like protein
MIGCGQKTDEDLIRELMEDVGKCIEKKDLMGLLAFLSDDFSDFRGRNRSQTEDTVQSYFNQFRGIVIHILHTRIDEVKAQEASIQSDIALSSGAARVLRKLVRVSTDIYRFKIKLIKKEDRWLIRYAEWTYIGLDELFPESLSILKKLFSDE